MDFCAGIGAGRLGFELSGLKCVAFSEINKSVTCTYNLLHSTKDEINFGDLTKIDPLILPMFDIMIAGFPCQTFSVMGQRKGFDDERGQIIYSLINILKTKNVPYFVLENVKGLINHNGGKTIKTIIQALEEAGYFVDYKVLNSLDYGVPQMRERVYFIGIRKDISIKNKKFEWPTSIATPKIKEYLIEENNEISFSQMETFKRYLQNKYNNGKFNLEDLLKNDYTVLDTRQSDLRIYNGKVPTLRSGRQGILYVKNGKLHSLTGYESILLQGFPKEYAIRTKGVNNSALLAQAGNAMTVTVISLISTSLLNYIKE
jgi:DNA (cytosine-5)-methyltransferase 1